MRNSLSKELALWSIWWILCIVPLPQSNKSRSPPASTSVEGPNLSMIGLGEPVPRSVTIIESVPDSGIIINVHYVDVKKRVWEYEWREPREKYVILHFSTKKYPP